jgi:hypothetical protein
MGMQRLEVLNMRLVLLIEQLLEFIWLPMEWVRKCIHNKNGLCELLCPRLFATVMVL